MVPDAVGATTIVTVAVALFASVPRAHVTMPALFEQVPVLAIAETKFNPAGNVSVTVTLVAEAGPSLAMVCHVVSRSLVRTGLGALLAVMARSAEPVLGMA